MTNLWTRVWKSLLVVAVGCAIYAAGCVGPDVGIFSDTKAQDAAASPVNALADRDVYYPGSETLGPDEMRVVACGT